jgi:hypothetical protein
MVVKLAGNHLSPHVYNLISHIEVCYLTVYSKCLYLCVISLSLLGVECVVDYDKTDNLIASLYRMSMQKL